MRNEQNSDDSNNGSYGDKTRYVPYSPTPPEKPHFPRVWIIILAVFAIPIGLPILMALLSIPFSIFIGAVTVFIALFFAGAALILSGIAGIASVPMLLFSDFGSGVFTGGMGLISIGIGILIVVMISRLFSVFFNFLALCMKRLARLFRKKRTAEELSENDWRMQ